jgi:Tfp pilus assembly protein PilF/cellobiose-specific phosphotransferase system component IIA
MQSPPPPKPEIPDTNDESLIPQKGGTLSAFAVLTWALIGLVLLGMTWLVLNKFDVARLRGASYFVTKAREALDLGNLPQALSEIQKVQGPTRETPDFLRLLAEYLHKSNTEPALLADVLERLEQTGNAQPDDLLWVSQSRFLTGDIRRARAAWNRLSSSQRSGLLAMKLNIDLLRKEGYLHQAAEIELQLFQLFPDEPEVAFRKAVKDLDGTFSEIKDAAWKVLFKLASNGGQTGLDAVRALSRRTELTLAEAEQLLKLAEAHPGITADDRLMLVSTIMRLDPAQREQRLKAEIERYRSAAPTILAQVAGWLAREKEYARIRELVPEDLLLSSPDLCPLVAHGVTEQQKWQELMDLLKKGKKLPVSNARAAAWRALAVRNLHPSDTKAARAHLDEAIMQGVTERNALALLGAASLAESWHMTDLALHAYQALAQPGSPGEVQMLEKCWEMASIQNDSALLASLAARFLKIRPDDLRFVRRNDYLCLLRGVGLETTLLAGDTPATSASDHLLEALKAYRLHDLAHASVFLREEKEFLKLAR